jgi:thiamine biosynthesis lipoprotein
MSASSWKQPAIALALSVITASACANRDPRGSGAVAMGRADAAALAAHARSVSYATRTMGTYANVTIVTTDSLGTLGAARAAHAAFARVDSLMTNWTETSEVARVNRELSRGPVTLEPETAGVVAASLEVWRDGEGAYDITVEPLVRLWGFLGGEPHVPNQSEITALLPRIGARHLTYDPATRTLAGAIPNLRIDLGGIAKGYGVDRAAAALREKGITAALVDLSGNMVAMGKPAGRDAWTIGVRDPRDRIAYFARLPLNDGEAIATSGKYEQFVADGGKEYGHILDPTTGWPAEGLISVTVVTHSAMWADAWDTPLFVLGSERARALVRRRSDLLVVIVEAGGDGGPDVAWVSKGLRERIMLEPAAASYIRVAYF